MNEVIAEIRIDNVFTSTIHVSNSPMILKSSRVIGGEPEEDIRILTNQGFVWFRDSIAFDMLSDYQSYWVKIAVAESLEIDSVIANAKKLRLADGASAILLPFQLAVEERVCVFGDVNDGVIFSFPLPAGHYQLLFQNRYFTREEVEAEPNFNCEDYDYWEDEIELCLLTFIPTKEQIEPKIFTYKSQLGTKDFSTPLILYDRKLHQNSDE